MNKKVGQTLAAGIEKGEQATEAVKDTVGEQCMSFAFDAFLHHKGIKTEQASKSAHQAKETAEHKANHVY